MPCFSYGLPSQQVSLLQQSHPIPSFFSTLFLTILVLILIHRKLVHGDLTPSNVMVCQHGDSKQVKITDFGLLEVCLIMIMMNIMMTMMRMMKMLERDCLPAQRVKTSQDFCLLEMTLALTSSRDIEYASSSQNRCFQYKGVVEDPSYCPPSTTKSYSCFQPPEVSSFLK